MPSNVIPLSLLYFWLLYARTASAFSSYCGRTYKHTRGNYSSPGIILARRGCWLTKVTRGTGTSSRQWPRRCFCANYFLWTWRNTYRLETLLFSSTNSVIWHYFILCADREWEMTLHEIGDDGFTLNCKLFVTRLGERASPTAALVLVLPQLHANFHHSSC